MYTQFFSLSRRPFPNTPDPTLYFPARSHRECVALLRYCIQEQEGIAVLMGPAGSGKTLVCHLLLEGLAQGTSAIFVTNPHDGSVAALLQAMLYDLGQPYAGLSEQELRLKVTDFLIDRFGRGLRTLLLIDEAHHLTVEQLEELRLLTNLEGREYRALQVVLIGQPNMEELLRDSRLASFRQRVGAVARLVPLDKRQSIEYVRHAVTVAGGRAEAIFAPEALSAIVDQAEGIPRRLNQLCHRTLLLAYTNEAKTVDDRYVRVAASQMMGETEPSLVVETEEAAADSESLVAEAVSPIVWQAHSPVSALPMPHAVGVDSTNVAKASRLSVVGRTERTPTLTTSPGEG